MPEPTSHTAAALIVSGVGAGTVSTALGLDYGALFWAFLGALSSRAFQPSIVTAAEIIQAGGYGIVSTVLGTLGSIFAAQAIIYFAPYLAVLDHQTIVALPAFLLGLLGHEIILRIIGLIREFRKGGQP